MAQDFRLWVLRLTCLQIVFYIIEEVRDLTQDETIEVAPTMAWVIIEVRVIRIDINEILLIERALVVEVDARANRLIRGKQQDVLPLLQEILDLLQGCLEGLALFSLAPQHLEASFAVRVLLGKLLDHVR